MSTGKKAKDSHKNIFARQMKKAMGIYDKNLKDVADLTGIDENTLASYYYRNTEPSVFMAKKIADALNVSVDFLVNEEEQLKSNKNQYMSARIYLENICTFQKMGYVVIERINYNGFTIPFAFIPTVFLNIMNSLEWFNDDEENVYSYFPELQTHSHEDNESFLDGLGTIINTKQISSAGHYFAGYPFDLENFVRSYKEIDKVSNIIMKIGKKELTRSEITKVIERYDDHVVYQNTLMSIKEFFINLSVSDEKSYYFSKESGNADNIAEFYSVFRKIYKKMVIKYLLKIEGIVKEKFLNPNPILEDLSVMRHFVSYRNQIAMISNEIPLIEELQEMYSCHEADVQNCIKLLEKYEREIS